MTEPEAISADDMPALLALNNQHATELSWLEPQRFSRMLGRAFYARKAGLAGFLLAFDADAEYDSPNYRWYRDRYRRFVYIDRVVVQHADRGRGLARRLYADLFARAAAAGHDVVGCEVNSDPPNPVSDAFHAALGFVPVGTAVLPSRGKTVRYMVRQAQPPG